MVAHVSSEDVNGKINPNNRGGNNPALNNQIQSIAFPNISTGIYKFPKNKAAQTAIKTVMDFSATTNKIETIVFVCFADENYNIYNDILKK